MEQADKAAKVALENKATEEAGMIKTQRVGSIIFGPSTRRDGNLYSPPFLFPFLLFTRGPPPLQE